MTYTENEYCWAVYQRTCEDGPGMAVAWFTGKNEADRYAAKIKGTVHQRTLYKGSDGWYYSFTPVLMPVNQVLHRESAISKLTVAERRALGV